MNVNKVDILGTDYTVAVGKEHELKSSGMCDIYTKEIECVNSVTCEDPLGIETTESVAHEVFLAFANEAGLDLDLSTISKVAKFYQKTWRKMSNVIYEVLDENQLVD